MTKMEKLQINEKCYIRKKTMDNLRNRIDIKLVYTKKTICVL